MQVVTTVGLDIAKSVFQVHGVDAASQAVIRRQLKRRYVLAFFEKLPPCLVGIEACASLHALQQWHQFTEESFIAATPTGASRDGRRISKGKRPKGCAWLPRRSSSPRMTATYCGWLPPPSGSSN